MDDPAVRYATSVDLELWREVRLRSLADAPEAFGSTLERERGFTPQDWRARVKAPAVLALHAGRPVGLAGGFGVRPGVLQVVAMWVEPDSRGHGLAARMLDLVVGWGREQRLEIELDVTRSNPIARAVYEGYGFVYTGDQEPLREGSSVLTDRMRLPRHD